MAFNSLSERIQMALRRVTGKAMLDEKDIEDMMREIRLSLLEADVNIKVVRAFTNDVKEKALGEKILKGLNPGQQVVKIVHEELKELMGNDKKDLNLNNNGTTVIMTAGLQGAGKTTAIGKLANYLRKYNKKNPLLIAADIYRPAAIDQLVTIGKGLNIPVFELGINENPVKIVKKGLEYAKDENYDLVIIDTAGRLHIDENLMNELKEVKKVANPDEILLVIDAMTGQDAVNVATKFNEDLDVTGVFLTKLDGDTRGGAALSIKYMTGIPIKLIGTGEKMDDFEPFHPDRMAQRILGMGDVLTLIEKATEAIDEDEAMNLMEKMMSGKYNYNDMLKQFKMVKKMGSFSKILGLIPGIGKIAKEASNIDNKEFLKFEVMIQSMTEEERKNPRLIDISSKRRQRIAKGSGKSVSDVNKLKEALEAQIKMSKQLSTMDEDKIKNMNPNNFQMTQKRSKGKGKNKGNFWRR